MLCTPYLTPADLVECDCPQDASPTVIELAIQSASEIEYLLTGKQYPGECEATVRPCGNSGSSLGWSAMFWSFPWVPILTGGVWINQGPCGCSMDACGCSGYPNVNLGRTDIQTVESVTLDGDDFTDYRLDSNQFLVRTDGGRWPCCQNLAADSGANTFIIELTYGRPIPSMLKRAATVLASELVKACSGVECALPKTTQTIVRQGATMELFDPAEIVASGATGLYEVDVINHALNPNHLLRAPRVYSPDLPTSVWS